MFFFRVDYIEDINMYLKDHQNTIPNNNVPNCNTVGIA